ncbi:hypothetical protein SNEBB_002829 [Seison nebaliae]|nr:hypothetical protein SNEBB_002829 [Seison nebaliae]
MESETSENFKVQLGNLPSKLGFAQLRKIFKKNGIRCVKLKKISDQHTRWYITFRNEIEREEAIEKLSRIKYFGDKITICKAAAAVDPIKQKKITKEDDSNENLTFEQFCKKAIDSIAYYSSKEYDEEIADKSREVSSYYNEMIEEVGKSNKLVKMVNLRRKKENSVKIIDMVKSPKRKFYRNKCEFSIGYDFHNELEIGFRSGLYRDGNLKIVSPSLIEFVPDEMMNIINIMKIFIGEKSNLKKIFDHQSHEGYWYQLTVRIAPKQIFVICFLKSQNLSEKDCMKESEDLRNFICERKLEREGLNIWMRFDETVFLHKSFRNYRVFGNDELLKIQMNGINFNFSPQSFFQVNYECCSLLYGEINEQLNIISSSYNNKSITLLDICCGTGTIGIISSKNKNIKNIIGIELVPEAIEDAKMNSKTINKTFYWLNGSVEEILPKLFVDREKYGKLIEDIESTIIVAIIDPPRAGVSQSVISCLRELQLMNHMMYISCDIKQVKHNFGRLLQERSKRCFGDPFFIKNIQSFDMFPLTKHFETFFLFERYSPIDVLK